jgi:hypothetical protein
MAPRSRTAGWLFRIACGAAMLLVLAVLVAPVLDAGQEHSAGWGRLLDLFARDSALRRTCLASATGLLVTACVFFQPAAQSSSGQGLAQRPKRSNVAGA